MGEYDAKQRQVAQPTSTKAKAAPSPKQDRLAVYLTDRSIARRVWQAVETHLARVDLPAPPRAVWTNEDRFVRATLEYMQPFELFLGRDRLPELLYPTKPYDAIAQIVPPGFGWEPAIGTAIAPLFEEAILGSLRRLGPKWIDHAENRPQPEALADETISLVAESALGPAHPMDLAVRRGLTANGVVGLKGFVLPANKRKQLQRPRKVKVEWEGARDRSLWNFVRPDPADATLEEVAAALFTSAFWRADGAVYAHRLTKVGALFRVPEAMARQHAGAREHLPSAGTAKGADVVAATSKSAVVTLRAAPISVPALRMKLASSITRLEYVQQALEPWRLDQTIAIGIAWAKSKQQQPDRELTKVSGAIAEQYELLGTVPPPRCQPRGVSTGRASDREAVVRAHSRRSCDPRARRHDLGAPGPERRDRVRRSPDRAARVACPCGDGRRLRRARRRLHAGRLSRPRQVHARQARGEQAAR